MPYLEGSSSTPSPLYSAACTGDVERLRAAIAAHPEQLDALDADSGCPPLAAAAGDGHTACVSVLLAAGAAVDAASMTGMTPPMLAAANGESAALRLLIQAGAVVGDGPGLVLAHGAVQPSTYP